MKKTIHLMFALALFSVPVFASEATSQPVSSPVAVSAKSQPNPFFELMVSSALINSYNRGALDQWFAERTGDPSQKVDAGSTAFWQLGAALYGQLENEDFLFGLSLDINIPPGHSFQGRYQGPAGTMEVALDSQIISLGLPVKIRLDKSSGLFLKITPSLLLGSVSGDYTGQGISQTYNIAPRYGFGLSGGLDWMFTSFLGVSAAAGVRVLQTPLVYTDFNTDQDPGGPSGFSQPLLNDGSPVIVDLGGTYLTVGLLLHL